MDPPTTLPKRKRPPFNPPRPRTAGGITKASKASKASSASTQSKPQPKSTARITTQKSAPSSSTIPRPKSSAVDNNVSDDDIRISRTPSQTPSNNGSPASPLVTASSDNESHSRSPSREPEYILAEITEPEPVDSREVLESSDPQIPPKLLTTLLHRHFQDDKTKIAKDAGLVVAKYVDIFVREALARAAYERTQGQNSKSGSRDASGRARAKVDSYLEVEDLEKLAPQMVVDF
ncbi:hypothetical protein ACJ73_10114 [Blastomyces percursus]|uniref:CENP-S associating centromere protein X domain-containing protein n=1 Tax=Blastomyces percursus TaxID=1658174 RepID=A0A1J9P062_9EURO|nr:hypothetical protein ACJ73_10114 [Blastomyces percursus]